MVQDINERLIEFFPEAVDPDAIEGSVIWKVTECETSQSRVDLENKEAWIPKARTRASEQVRFHELAHVGHTDNHDHESEWMTGLCKMLEEYRVDLILARENGLPLHHRHDDYNMEWLSKRAPREQFSVALEWLQFRFAVEDPTVAPDVMAYWQLIAARLPLLTVEKLEEAIAGLARDVSPESREREARKLHDYFMPPPPKKHQQPAPLKEEVQQEVEKQIQEERVQKAEERRQAEAPKGKKKVKSVKPEEIEEAKRERNRSNHEDGLDQNHEGGVGCHFIVGRMEVHDHTARSMYKTQPVKAPFTQTSKGITPEFMDRYCMDQRIFRKEHRGGVILLDCSGSMRPDWSQITQQILEFPNLVVMSYQGIDAGGTYTGSTTRGKTVSGRLCIYSRGGRIDPIFMVEPGHSGGNMVDWEALTFASRFRGPRIWLSDGKATGGQYDTDGSGYSDYNSNLQKLCREVMRRHHWVRIRHLGQAFDYLTGRRPVEYHLVGVTSPDKPHETRFGRR